MIANSHSQAQCQVAQAYAKPKPAIELCLSANADFADTKKNKSFKTEKTE